jgi:hypothetical protein
MIADEHYCHFTGLLIHLRAQPQLIRPAHQTFNIEFTKRAGCRRLERLIIFPALKIACSIHAHSLLQALDNGCPGQNFSSGLTQDKARMPSNATPWIHREIFQPQIV